MIFIACGPEHMMSVSAYKHELYAWGNNIYGQLGIRATGINSGFNEHKEKTASDIRVYKPNQVPLIIGDINLKVEMVALGMYHSVLLSTDKYLYSCGLKKYAGIQLNDLTQPFEFLDIFTLILKLRNTKFKMIASGEFHSLALSENNDVYGWGSCLFGRLGEKFWKEGEEAILEENENEIKRIGAAEDIKLIELPELLYENPSRKSNKEMKFVGCGPTHSASINKHGEVFTWGSGICGKLGVKLEDFFTVTAFEKPEDKVDELKKRKKISSFVMPKNRVFFKYKKGTIL